MNFIFKKDTFSNQTVDPYLAELTKIFAEIDLKYNEAAKYYGFNCNSCQDNCCKTKFYHHTFIEFFYIQKGFENLKSGEKIEIKVRALLNLKEYAEAEKKNKKIQVMCPFNSKGMCVIYFFRPLICRLHGISHELVQPYHNIVYGQGCECFISKCGEKKYYKFDRTPFYLKISQLEKGLKNQLGFTQKFKMTLSQMIAAL